MTQHEQQSRHKIQISSQKRIYHNIYYVQNMYHIVYEIDIALQYDTINIS